MLGHIVHDFGVRDADGYPPAWLRQNPFFLKTLRAETQRGGFMLRLFLCLTLLVAMLIGGLLLNSAYPERSNVEAATIGFQVPTLLFALISFVHVLFISSTRTAMATSLATEERRQTLGGLLMTPMRRAEMVLAMGVGPAAGVLIMAIAALPIYVVLQQLGGIEWSGLILLYTLFAMLAFSIPTSTSPALSGAVNTPETPSAPRTVNSRNNGNPSAVFSGFWYGFVILGVANALSIPSGGWITHLIGVLPISFSTASPVLLVFWPYEIIRVLGTPLPFFQGSVMPWIYVIPLVGLGRFAAALGTAATLSAGDVIERQRLPIAVRFRSLSRWVSRTGMLCMLAFLWRPWVLSGDTGGLIGDHTGNFQWGVAGLLLLLGSITLVGASYRIFTVPITLAGDIKTSLRRMRRAARKAMLPLRFALVLFVVGCLFGHQSPFTSITIHVFEELLAVTVASLVFCIGVASAQTPVNRGPQPINRRRIIFSFILMVSLLYVLPILLLLIPNKTAWTLAALSPAAAWLRLFAGSESLMGPSGLIAHVINMPFGILPNLATCIIVSTITGFGLILIGLVRVRASQSVLNTITITPLVAQSPVKLGMAIATRPILYAAQTARLMHGITSRVDNAVFIREVRARTRNGQWYRQLKIAPWVFGGALLVAHQYPDMVSEFSTFAFISFFHRGLLATFTTPSQPYTDLAGLLLTWQVYRIGFRGQIVGEQMMQQDRLRGTLGFLLITPLKTRQIFWGSLWGQMSTDIVHWCINGTFLLILYLLASPTIGIGPALTAWIIGQIAVACLTFLGVAVGAAMATHTSILRFLQGLSTVLLVGIILLGVLGIQSLIPSEQFYGQPQWIKMAVYLSIGSVLCTVLSCPAFAYAYWRLARMRSRDIIEGDVPVA